MTPAEVTGFPVADLPRSSFCFQVYSCCIDPTICSQVLKCAWGKNTSAAPPTVAPAAPMLNLAAALQGVHLGNSQNMNGLQSAMNPTMMASLAAANLMAAAAAASGGSHANNAGFNGALLGMSAHGLMAPHGGSPPLVGGGMQGLMGLNAPLMYNQASLQQVGACGAVI